VAAGIGVRLHDRLNHPERSDTVIKARSPFGYVVADPGAVFDFYVGENSAEVVAVRGKVSPVHAATSARYDLSAGSPSVLADQSQITFEED
jgi:hypothetical protein